jgi:hypothetical protein
MRNTIRNSVKEVYTETNNNASFNKSLMNNNDVLNENALKENTNANNLLNKIKNVNKNTNSSNNKKYVNRNTTIKRNTMSDTTEVITSVQSGLSSYVIIFIFLFVMALISLFVFFQESILHFFKQLFNDEEKDKVIGELTKNMEEDKNKQNKMNDEIQSLKDEIKQLVSAKEDKKKQEKKNDTKRVKPSKDILQQYSKSQILKSDGYCFVGSDNNTRHCVKAYEGEICSSGDIYGRIDECIVPGIRT